MVKVIGHINANVPLHTAQALSGLFAVAAAQDKAGVVNIGWYNGNAEIATPALNFTQLTNCEWDGQQLSYTGVSAPKEGENYLAVAEKPPSSVDVTFHNNNSSNSDCYLFFGANALLQDYLDGNIEGLGIILSVGEQGAALSNTAMVGDGGFAIDPLSLTLGDTLRCVTNSDGTMTLINLSNNNSVSTPYSEHLVAPAYMTINVSSNTTVNPTSAAVS